MYVHMKQPLPSQTYAYVTWHALLHTGIAPFYTNVDNVDETRHGD